MIPKISLTAAFFLMVAPPMACASNREATNPAPITRQAHASPLGMVVAQDDQPNARHFHNDNDNDSDSNDSADDNQNADGNQNADENQNADGNQTDQQNAADNDQSNPPQVPDGSENDGPERVPQAFRCPRADPLFAAAKPVPIARRHDDRTTGRNQGTGPDQARAGTVLHDDPGGPRR